MKELTLNHSLAISGGKIAEPLALSLLAGITLGAPLFACSGIYIYPHFTPLQVIAMGSVGAYAGAIVAALSWFLLDSYLSEN